MAYNSQYTGAQIDEAVGDVRENKEAWGEKELPAVTASDNGKVMMVVDGRWTKGDASSGTKVTQYSGTLLANSWAEDAYGYQAQTITITGLKASYDVDPQWDEALSGTDPDADAALLEGFALIHNYTTGANSLTAQCIGKAPTVNIPVKVVVFG